MEALLCVKAFGIAEKKVLSRWLLSALRLVVVETTDKCCLATFSTMLQLLVVQSAVATLKTGVIMIGTLLNLINS
ncbi:MAG: hypothetical protein COA36_13870 [Desulfotalea sp.]|nr:MAG: hypothetical protein COA36_13870 [Desulfotalea sp.]